MSNPLWLVTFAYYTEQADVYVVAAPDEAAARERVGDLEAVGQGRDGEWVRRAVMERAQVERVRDGLHVSQHAER